MRQHAMLDLETLDLSSTAVVVHVGVVIFNAEGIEREVECFPGLQWQIDAGRTINPGTLAWWMKQSEPVRGLIDGRAGNSANDVDAFFAWTRDESIAGVWGNGADFDNATIIHLAAQNRWRPPWNYRANRCFRTIRNIKGADELDVNFKGVEHNALDDARYQAERLIRINNAFGGIFL